MGKDRFENKKIAIIGGGHMGSALAQGLARGGKVKPEELWIANPAQRKIASLKKFGIQLTSSNPLAVSKADIIFIAVKPGQIKGVLEEIRLLAETKLLVSTASVPTIGKLKTLTKGNQRIARIMPNLPVRYNQGVIGYFGKNIKKVEETELLDILSSLGTVVKLKTEEEIDLIDVASSCGPAIVSTFIEMMSGYMKKKGIKQEIASKAVLQMFAGSVNYLNQSGLSPSQFIESVATKGGITETILKNLEKDFRKIFMQAMEEGYIKTKKLNKSW